MPYRRINPDSARNVLSYIGKGKRRYGKAAAAAAIAYYLWKRWRARRSKKVFRKTRKLTQRAQSLGTGGSFSKFNYGIRRMPRTLASMYKNTSKFYKSDDFALRLSANSSLQNFRTVNRQFDTKDITDMFNNVATSQYTGSRPSLRVNLESASTELSLTNQTNCNARITIYEIIARRDSGYYDMLGTILDPVQTFTQGAAWESDDSVSRQMYCFSPFTVDFFTQYFKVLKMTHILLAEGQTHIHRNFWKPNKVLNGALLESQYDPDGSMLRGLTTFTMLQVSGVPADDNANTTSPNVSTTRVELDIVGKTTYRYGFLQNNQTNLDIHTNLPELETVYIEDIADGAVEAQHVA